ncbi:MAG: sigma-54-dependent transcriptional regulator [Acidobacteriota bacterium]
MRPKETILIVDDDEAIRTQLSWALGDEHEVLQASGREEALAATRGGRVDLVLLDLRLPPLPDEITEGREILEAILRIHPSLPVIIMTGDRDRRTAVEMVARGAFDLFRKPVDPDELRIILRRALRMRRLEREVRRLRGRLEAGLGIDDLVGRSPAMRGVARLVRRVADTGATVLITGESGTGKELIARAFHRHSARREGPFVALNCTAIPAGLIDDELFGHERGAFTGAAGRRIGKFEYASGGTLFLDEVGDLPGPVQVKLLRVLQESEIQRLGGNETIGVDVRLLAATHQDLEEKCREASFREDLYYRLKVVTLAVPPLRDRSGDIPLLADHFLTKHATRGSPRSFSPAAMEALGRFHWPGNVRQLENLVNALCVTCEADAVELSHLPPELRGAERAAGAGAAAGVLPAALPAEGIPLAAVERELIERALRRTGGNRTRAAGLLGVSRHVLLGLLKKHRLGS